MYVFKLVILFSLAIDPEVELLDHMVVLLVFLRNLHTVFHSGYTNLHSHQWCSRVPFSIVLPKYFVFFFLMIVILICVRWYFFVVLIYISLMISAVWPSFHLPVGHLYVFFGKMSDLWFFLNLGICFLTFSCMGCYFGY